MYTIDYSVIIRTTGNAHNKYQALLNSISKLQPQPKEVIVVLPEGYEIPKEKIGWEKFYFSPKGMVIQRLVGINECTTQYALVCDDDIQFDEEFVQKLYEPIKNGLCQLTVGPLYSFLPSKGINSIIAAIMANAVPTLFHKDRYISILRSSGYSYNRNLETENEQYFETQSAPWTCFFGNIDAIKAIGLEDEIWLDKHGYSAMDDQTMFYKGWLRKIKTITVSNAIYIHLDAGTSKNNNQHSVLFSTSFNRIVFWHRFIYCKQDKISLKIWSIICIHYYLIWLFLFDIHDLLRKRLSGKDLLVKRKGCKEGWRYIKSSQYKEIPPA